MHPSLSWGSSSSCSKSTHEVTAVDWVQNPFHLMGLINIASGLFSAFAGWLAVTSKHSAPLVDTQLQPTNPWLYVIGGAITALIGVGNMWQLGLATWGTVGFILTSVYDGWFGQGSKDFRFYTLTAFVLVQSSLVLWSTQLKSLLNLL